MTNKLDESKPALHDMKDELNRLTPGYARKLANTYQEAFTAAFREHDQSLIRVGKKLENLVDRVGRTGVIDEARLVAELKEIGSTISEWREETSQFVQEFAAVTGPVDPPNPSVQRPPPGSSANNAVGSTVAAAAESTSSSKSTDWVAWDDEKYTPLRRFIQKCVGAVGVALFLFTLLACTGMWISAKRVGEVLAEYSAEFDGPGGTAE